MVDRPLSADVCTSGSRSLRGHIQLFHPFFHALHSVCIKRPAHFLSWLARTVVAFLVATVCAEIMGVPECIIALFAVRANLRTCIRLTLTVG